jgi:hypothetical protein
MYYPEELETPRLEPGFGYWIPYMTPWYEFKKIADRIYRCELKNYRARTRKLWGAGQPKSSQHAHWAVLWQQGQSPEAIRRRYLRITGKNVSVASIQLAVHKFSEEAGITMRARKAGPGVKKT